MAARNLFLVASPAAAQNKVEFASKAKLVAEKFAKEFIQEKNVAEAMKLTSAPFFEIEQGREKKPRKMEKSVEVEKQIQNVVKRHDEMGIRAKVIIVKIQGASGEVSLDKSTMDVFNPKTDRIYIVQFDQERGFTFSLLTLVAWREDQLKVVGYGLYFSR